MLNINDIKNGMTIIYEGNVYQVIEFQHVKPGKGAAFVRTKLKNLKANTTREVTFNSDIKIEKARVDKKQLSYLYNAGNNYVFMDNSTYEQMKLDKNTLGDNIKFLKEGLNVDIMLSDGEILGISLPDKITYKVIEAADAVKGNTTSTAQKDVKIETGYTLKTPLFIKEGEEIIITTSDGKYSSRA